MGDKLNLDAELERLEAIGEQIARLREKVKVLKEKESDVSSNSAVSDDEELINERTGSRSTSKNY